jgi:hypothetical protein
MLFFPTHWDQWQKIPFNKKHIEKMLTDDDQRKMPGVLKYAILSDTDSVRVLAGIHRGGAPGAARVDPQPHITLSFGGRSYHVRLTRTGGIFQVTS